MRYYAKVVNGIVTQVIVANPSFFETFVDSSPGAWVETYTDGSSRKNYAGIGYSYDANRDAFIAPKPYNSWVLDENTCRWNAPIPYPNDGQNYKWDETQQNWILQS